MNLYAKLTERAAEGRPLRVGLIGAGKFGAMYLAQIPKTPGVHLAGIADLSPASARTNLERVGWKPERHAAPSLDAALGHAVSRTWARTGRRSSRTRRSISSWRPRGTRSRR